MTPGSRQPLETAPARMGALARLPVFVELDGKRAVVSGGTAAAAWKAELLAAAGAHVEIFAAAAGSELVALVERGGAPGKVIHIAREVAPTDLAGAAIAVADAAGAAEAAAFAEAARAAGVPMINVVDKPDYSQFQFGSIVNRSPVVIGISTSGGAPVLAQAIRRRIETLLPPALAGWASIAKTIRPVVAGRLAPGTQRRAFWERFAELAFGPAPRSSEAACTDAIIDQVACAHPAAAGCVTLVGAGPGSAELLTLKAVRALQAADVILYDDLVSEDVLELARREAKRMLVGKRGQRESCRQDDINALMVKLARQGRNVVRLKSGDPAIFGRAGEEIAVLNAAGIAVEVVPGITSASALAAALGISLTHRELAHSVRFVTGHSRNGELPDDLDWRGLADPETTLIVYMGGRTARQIAQRLMSEGRDGDTPICMAVSVSRPGMTVVRTTLDDVAKHKPDLPDGPVLIGVGALFGSGSAATQMQADDAPLRSVRP